MKYQKETFSWVQGGWFAAGLILLGSSFFAMSPAAGDLVSVSHGFGLAMLFAGCTNIVIAAKRKKTLHGSHWILVDGLSTSLLSFFPLFNQMILSAMIPFFFGVWELFSGILKVVDAGELKSEGIRKWGWFMAVGSIEVLSGVAALLKPVEEFVGMNAVIAVVLFIQSIGYVLKACMYPELNRADVNT